MKDIKGIFLNRIRQIERSYTNYVNNPFDPERAHTLRINIRELRSLLNFIKSFFDEDIYTEWSLLLKNSAQIYGPIRELDVLIELCSKLALENPDLSQNYKSLFNQLHNDRRKEMRRTFNITNTRLIENTLATITEGLEDLDWKHYEDTKIDWSKYIDKRIHKRATKLKKAYKETNLKDFEEIHETRKDAKKVRYALNYLGKLSHKNVTSLCHKAEEIQDDFGEFTDHHINHQLLINYTNSVEDSDLQLLFKSLTDLQQVE